MAKKRLEDADVLKTYNDRFSLMWSARSPFESERKLCDEQFEAITTVDNDNNVQVNIPLEKSYIEYMAGRWAGQTTFEIVPEGKVDVQELQSAKYTLDHFMNDTQSDYNRYNERRKWDLDALKYGTSVFYTGLTHTKETCYELTEDAESLYDDDYSEISKDKYSLVPRNISLRNIWIDYSALRQPDFSKAKFIVMQEVDTPENLKMRRKGIKGFKNIEDIVPFLNMFPAYVKTNIRQDEAMVHYYFDRVTKDYWIIVNRNIVVYVGKMLYAHGKLPFDLRQCYPNTASLYGEGVCKRVRTMKGFKNTMMNAMLKRVEMTSGINLGLGNNMQTNGQLYTGAGEINIRQFTGGIEQVKQFQLDPNISSQVGAISAIDGQIAQDIGEDLRGQFQPAAQQLGTMEIMEEKQAIRQKTPDELRDESIQRSLTMMLRNIVQFAPALMKREVYEKVGVKKVLVKTERPIIKIPNSSIKKKKGGEMQIEEDYGKYGYFELKPSTITGDLTVRITTPSTRSSMKVLEKNSITQYIQNMTSIIMALQADPVKMGEVIKQIDVKGLMDWMNTTYGYDTKLSAQTKKDQEKEKQMRLAKSLFEGVGMDINPDQPLDVNQLMNAGSTGQGGTGPQGIGLPPQAPGGAPGVTAGSGAEVGMTQQPPIESNPGIPL